MLYLRNLASKSSKHYQLAPFTLRVMEGSITGILTKANTQSSHLADILAGLLKIEDGVYELQGKNLLAEPVCLRHTVGYVPMDVALPYKYTKKMLAQLIHYYFARDALDGKDQLPQILVETINDILKHGSVELSQSQTFFLMLAFVLSKKPKILVIHGMQLDSLSKELLILLSKKYYIIFLSDDAQELADLCAYIAIVVDNKVILEGNPQELAEASPLHKTIEMILAPSQNNDVYLQSLQTLTGIAYVKTQVLSNREYKLTIFLDINAKKNMQQTLASIDHMLEKFACTKQLLTVNYGKLIEVFHSLAGS
jgi:ABC-type Na+ transport system ATPase subunit NatA